MSLKIGVIADTHRTKETERLKIFLEKHLSEVDHIIHVGDFIRKEVVELLRRYKGFTGVWGNNDPGEVRGLLKETDILELCGYRIGLFHGHGERGTTVERAWAKFEDVEVDVIIFGHSHQPIVMTKKNVLLINPGSPTSKRRERWFSYVILDLLPEGINAHINFWGD